MNSIFKINGWTALFGLLLIVNIIAVMTILNVLTEEPKSIEVKNQHPAQSENTLTLKPEVVNHYLKQENTETMKLTLSDQQLLIEQESEVIGQKIKTNVLTTPVVIGHNKLRLNIKEVKVAGLPLSKKRTLNIIKRFGTLPNNVELDVRNECFYYDMEPIKLDGTALDLTHIDQTGWHFNIIIEE
ncbi:DUF2140 family protein [Macrococcus lamae]|uniref:DUF2140 family protein n=1 Tax=Macrococcus lamae TaxID=198484 RepID=A0A4V6PPU0_9STAP|nr:DUF2140 family protein [Macrococcus lamae]TDM13256.1 DUF2140 family protein [Macrococcus lamae]